MREVGIAGGLLANGQQAQPGQHQAEHAADQADRARFHQALREDGLARRTQGAPHADLRRAAQELRQQQSHGVEQADRQEAERQPYLQADVAGHRALLVQPLHDVVQVHVGRALETARCTLLVGIVLQVLLVGLDLLGRAQLDPVLQPRARRIRTLRALFFRTGVAPAVHVALGAHLQRARRPERHEQLLHLGEAVLGHVVELGSRPPLVQHADHAERRAGGLDFAPHAVGAAEQFLVQRLGDDGHARARFVIRRRPAVAVAERHVEHREEIGRGVARIDAEGFDPAVFRFDRGRATGHEGLPIALLVAQQALGVVAGELVFRLVAGGEAIRRARVDARIEQLVALLRDGIAGQHIEHGQRGHAGADAQRDRQHHQEGQRLVALEAAQREGEVVAEHAWLRRVGPGPPCGRLDAVCGGPWGRLTRRRWLRRHAPRGSGRAPPTGRWPCRPRCARCAARARRVRDRA